MLFTLLACAWVSCQGEQGDGPRPQYTIAATIAADERSVRGTATIRAPGNSGTMRFGIKRLRVTRVRTADGAALVARFDRDSAIMTVPITVPLVVEYVAASDTNARRQLGYELFPSTGNDDTWYPVLEGHRFADFDVTLDAPGGVALLTTAGSGRTLSAAAVEGFALAFSQAAVLTRVTNQGITVTALSPAADTAIFRGVAEAALRAATWYQAMYGSFPVHEIGVVPGYAGARGGFPLPNMFMIHRGDLSASFVRWITAHELAHYYWGLSVLDAQERLGWLSLGLGIWTDQLFLARTAGVPLAAAWRDPRGDDSFEDFAEAAIAGYDQRLGLPESVVDSLDYDYNSLVRHGKAATGIYLLGLRLGEDRFVELQKRLLETYHRRPLSIDAFGAELERAGVADARGFLAAWSKGDASLGFRVAGVDQVGEGTWRIRIRRTGTIPFPVTVEAITASGRSARGTITGAASLDSIEVDLDAEPADIRLDPDGVLPMQSSDNIEMRRVFVRALGAVGGTPLFVAAATRHLDADPDTYVAAQLIERLFESGRYRETIEVSNRIPAIAACTDRQTCLAAIQVARALARSGDKQAASALYLRLEASLRAYGRTGSQRAQLFRSEAGIP